VPQLFRTSDRIADVKSIRPATGSKSLFGVTIVNEEGIAAIER